MRARCYSSSNDKNWRYKENGIIMCDAWYHSFDVFADWALTHGYQEDLDLDRIDNNAGYSPENCCFRTHMQNVNNKGTYKKVSSLPVGVYLTSEKRFRAQIQIDNKKVSLGTFDTPEQAHKVFLDARQIKRNVLGL